MSFIYYYINCRSPLLKSLTDWIEQTVVIATAVVTMNITATVDMLIATDVLLDIANS